jgi:hypothetical protein
VRAVEKPPDVDDTLASRDPKRFDDKNPHKKGSESRNRMKMQKGMVQNKGAAALGVHQEA